jgi:hypothetical protein
MRHGFPDVENNQYQSAENPRLLHELPYLKKRLVFGV